MLELSMICFVFAAVAQPFGAVGAASTALPLSGLFFLLFLGVGFIGLIFQQPIERRITHHA